MHPAFSVILLTTLIGAGQGLFLALYASQIAVRTGSLTAIVAPEFYVWGSIVALALLVGGLIASFFHLGRPERAWRSATRWRTSWLSREVIVLPAVMFTVFVYAIVNYLVPAQPGAVSAMSIGVGTVGALLCLALFVCTGMIYACMRFFQEWATPLTVINFTLLGSASGFTLAAALAAVQAPALTAFLVLFAAVLTVLGFVGRGASLWRNQNLKRKSTLQSAIGVRHPQIRQVAQGAMGGSFNTREFFHGQDVELLRTILWSFTALAFGVPLLLLGLAAITGYGPVLLSLAALAQLAGLILERWYFFADANHPQNLYYQAA